MVRCWGVKIMIFAFLRNVAIFTGMKQTFKDQIAYLNDARLALHRCL